MNKNRVAIFASGTGSNAMNLIHYFSDHPTIEIVFVLTNNNKAPIIQSSQSAGIPVHIYNNEEVADASLLLKLCQKEHIDWIVLAGYLRLIPNELIKAYDNKMINLHPSLLPNYGGKGMYGRNVHEAVIKNKETESGITIHFVNQEFDKGEIIKQFKCSLTPDDTVETLERKIRTLEQENLPLVVENTITKQS